MVLKKETMMNNVKNDCFELMNKIEKKIKPTFEEFIKLIGYGLEMQFFFKKRKFGITHFNGYEFYEWNNEIGYQNYDNIEEFSKKINIDGILVKNLWDNISKVDFTD